MKKTTKLKEMINNDELGFLMEAHDGISAKIVEETGFEGIWGSGLCISAQMGVRDSNEASWTQILEVCEFMSDVTNIPLLLDGDTGYGNFNNMRRLVKKLEQRGVAGVCIEDKLFPKTNSFISGECQPLASIDEFAGKIKAGKDTQQDEDFCIVARVEAFIAGWGLEEALRRAEAYHKAGADAILIHSKIKKPNEVLSFMKEWGDRLPVVIVPTKFYTTPTEVFQKAGVSLVIWANHLMRCSVTAMQQTASKIYEEQTLLNIEDEVATVSEIFRLQCAEELQEAEKKYLPSTEGMAKAVILAAARGKEFGALTEDIPKALINIKGKPLLNTMVSIFNEIGIKDINIVRGYKKETIKLPNINYVDNDEYESTQEVFSLYKGVKDIKGTTLVSYGDILFKKYIPMMLLETEGDINIVVDADWEESKRKGRYTNYVSCDIKYQKEEIEQKAILKCMDNELAESEICGEWIGLLKASEKGMEILNSILEKMQKNDNFRQKRIGCVFNDLVKSGHEVHVIYIKGHWLDIDDLHDFSKAGAF